MNWNCRRKMAAVLSLPRRVKNLSCGNVRLRNNTVVWMTNGMFVKPCQEYPQWWFIVILNRCFWSEFLFWYIIFALITITCVALDRQFQDCGWCHLPCPCITRHKAISWLRFGCRVMYVFKRFFGYWNRWYIQDVQRDLAKFRANSSRITVRTEDVSCVVLIWLCCKFKQTVLKQPMKLWNYMQK